MVTGKIMARYYCKTESEKKYDDLGKNKKSTISVHLKRKLLFLHRVADLQNIPFLNERRHEEVDVLLLVQVDSHTVRQRSCDTQVIAHNCFYSIT
jgi:hypothetical protein